MLNTQMKAGGQRSSMFFKFVLKFSCDTTSLDRKKKKKCDLSLITLHKTIYIFQNWNPVILPALDALVGGLGKSPLMTFNLCFISVFQSCWWEISQSASSWSDRDIRQKWITEPHYNILFQENMNSNCVIILQMAKQHLKWPFPHHIYFFPNLLLITITLTSHSDLPGVKKWESLQSLCVLFIRMHLH